MCNSNDYERPCEDELDWKDVDQLHQATLQISKSCFEYKKLCISFLGVSTALIVKFTENSLNHTVFVLGLLICVGFWISDATGYYFQKKLRKQLDERMYSIANRNNYSSYARPPNKASTLKSLFNGSMVFYYVLILTIFVIWGLCYRLGVINK